MNVQLTAAFWHQLQMPAYAIPISIYRKQTRHICAAHRLVCAFVRETKHRTEEAVTARCGQFAQKQKRARVSLFAPNAFSAFSSFFFFRTARAFSRKYL